MTTWVREYFILVRAADRDLANARYANVDPDVGGERTFLVPLSVSGNPPAQAYGARTRATLAMVQKYGERIQDLIDAGRLVPYRLDNGAFTIESALADTTKKAAALLVIQRTEV